LSLASWFWIAHAEVSDQYLSQGMCLGGTLGNGVLTVARDTANTRSWQRFGEGEAALRQPMVHIADRDRWLFNRHYIVVSWRCLLRRFTSAWSILWLALQGDWLVGDIYLWIERSRPRWQKRHENHSFTPVTGCIRLNTRDLTRLREQWMDKFCSRLWRADTCTVERYELSFIENQIRIPSSKKKSGAL
jgi:hypothetical protein